MATIPTSPDASSYSAIATAGRNYSGVLSIPASAHSLDGFRQWALSEDFPDEGRITFVDGELIVEMTPEFIETHNFIKTEITSVVHERSKRLRLGCVFSDGCLLSNRDAKISTEPDATFATYNTLASDRCRILRSNRPGVGEEIIGVPDWVLEIVSSSSMRKDKKLLREGYYRAGIGEYWLVDALSDDIDFQILVPGQDGYVTVQAQDDWLASPIFGCSFRLTREKDEGGYWQYTLGIQEKNETVH